MVSRNWERDPLREAVADLLEDPYSVYRLYNETLEKDQADLRIALELVEALARMH